MIHHEYILCAAIWYEDEIIHDNQPYNILRGYIIVGRRHGDCKETKYILTGLEDDIYDNHGFITNKNRFVNRKEAYIIALKAKQIDNSKVKNELHSTDLY